LSIGATERAKASSPETPLVELATLAYEHPELRALIAANPSTYEDLLAWLRELRDPAVDAALASRGTSSGASALTGKPSALDPMPVVVAWQRVPRSVKLVSVISVAAVVLAAIIAGSVTAAAQQRLEEAVSDHDQRQADADAEAAASAEPSVAPAPEPVENSASWNFANKAGYSFTEQITIGTPVRYDADNPPTHPYTDDTIAGTACSLSATDLVIPVKWLARATTESFDTSIAMTMVATPPQGAGYTVLVEQFFSDGAQCQSDTDLSRLNVRFNNPLKTGTATWQALFVIIKGYFAPNRPDGDPSILGQVSLRPTFSVYDASQSTDMYVDQAPGARSVALTLAGTTVR
jgi:hypothetical protein